MATRNPLPCSSQPHRLLVKQALPLGRPPRLSGSLPRRSGRVLRLSVNQMHLVGTCSQAPRHQAAWGLIRQLLPFQCHFNRLNQLRIQVVLALGRQQVALVGHQAFLVRIILDKCQQVKLLQLHNHSLLQIPLELYQQCLKCQLGVWEMHLQFNMEFPAYQLLINLLPLGFHPC